MISRSFAFSVIEFSKNFALLHALNGLYDCS
jgi:hypothetical protein